MLIAVTARGDGLEAPIDERFGRATRFVLYDTESREVRNVDNDMNLNAAQGAGIQAAQNLAGLGAECLLTGHCGPKAFRTLAAAGVRVFTGAAGTVRQTIDAYVSGSLRQATGADVDSHWA